MIPLLVALTLTAPPARDTLAAALLIKRGCTMTDVLIASGDKLEREGKALAKRFGLE